MKLTNQQIYDYALALNEFIAEEQEYIPARANFYINKNVAVLNALGQEIEQARLKIAKHYGMPNEDNTQYIISKEQMEKVNDELTALFSIEQDVNIIMFSLKDLDDIKLTPKRMQMIMFMVEE